MNEDASAHETQRHLSPPQRCRAVDPLGDRVHLTLTCLAALAVAADTGPAEIAFLALLVCFLARLPRIARCLRPFFRKPLVWLVLAWSTYAALSLAWSPDARQGTDELLRVRFMLLPLLIYPVLHQSGRLYVSVLLGVALLHLAQAAQLAGVLPEWLAEDYYIPTRNGGMMHPVTSANIIACAAALHLGALLVALDRPRSPRLAAASAAGLLAALVGLLLTGSRGPWLAALLVLPLQGVVTLVRLPAARRAGLVLLGPLLLGGALASIPLAPLAATRLEQARADVTQALRDGDYTSDTGARIFMAKVAWRMFLDRPLLGHGGGSYRAVGAEAAQRLHAEEEIQGAGGLIHGHAHNLFLHEAATRGVVGLGLVLAMFVGAYATAWRSVEAKTVPWREGLPWAIAAMAACALFDHPLITHNCAYATMLLFGLALAPPDPRVRQSPAGATSSR